ncbi:MAG: hypothetical protein VCE12_04900 [Candidatus Latescibacterota bacterium]
MPDSPDLTTRDVFAQIDRRLTRLEDDLREFRYYAEQRFSTLEAKFDTKIDRNFRWTIGITMAAWQSIMSTILLK